MPVIGGGGGCSSVFGVFSLSSPVSLNGDNGVIPLDTALIECPDGSAPFTIEIDGTITIEQAGYYRVSAQVSFALPSPDVAEFVLQVGGVGPLRTAHDYTGAAGTEIHPMGCRIVGAAEDAVVTLLGEDPADYQATDTWVCIEKVCTDCVPA